jgi:hypothetical protein
LFQTGQQLIVRILARVEVGKIIVFFLNKQCGFWLPSLVRWFKVWFKFISWLDFPCTFSDAAFICYSASTFCSSAFEFCSLESIRVFQIFYHFGSATARTIRIADIFFSDAAFICYSDSSGSSRTKMIKNLMLLSSAILMLLSSAILMLFFKFFIFF